jgi:hypothetical protein
MQSSLILRSHTAPYRSWYKQDRCINGKLDASSVSSGKSIAGSRTDLFPRRSRISPSIRFQNFHNLFAHRLPLA